MRLVTLLGTALLAVALLAPRLAAQAPSVTIDMRDFAFEPRDIGVVTGTTVRWVNRDDSPHSVAMEGRQPGSSAGVVAPGAEHTFVFRQSGRFTYRCSVHPTMLGEITVVP